jgi:hypothetical protein
LAIAVELVESELQRRRAAVERQDMVDVHRLPECSRAMAIQLYGRSPLSR